MDAAIPDCLPVMRYSVVSPRPRDNIASPLATCSTTTRYPRPWSKLSNGPVGVSGHAYSVLSSPEFRAIAEPEEWIAAKFIVGRAAIYAVVLEHD